MTGPHYCGRRSYGQQWDCKCARAMAGWHAYVAAGDIVGEIAVLGRRPRTATVTTCSPLIGHPIPVDVFLSYLARRPQAWHAVSLMIADRLDWANLRRLDFAGHDVTVHIARVIVAVLDLYGQRSSNTGELGVSLSQQELGSLVGAGKDAAAKATRRLREMGLIETRYRTIFVRDLAGLRAAAGLSDAKLRLSSVSRSCSQMYMWLLMIESVTIRRRSGYPLGHFAPSSACG